MTSAVWNQDAENYVDFILDQPNWREIQRIVRTTPQDYDEVTTLAWLEDLSDTDRAIFEPVRAIICERYSDGNLGIVFEKVKHRLLKLKLV